MLMVQQMEYLSAVGSSRFVAFYADGDGNFRPQIDVGVSCDQSDLPESAEDVFFRDWDEVRDMEQFCQWSDNVCWIDFDPIAWYLSSKEEENDENA